MAARRLDYVMTLRIKGEEVFFGPGVVTVMEKIEQTGSLSKAAKQMGMSYNKAWRILQRAEKNWGQPLVETNIGGASGGGTQLTAEGRKLVVTYVGFRQEAEAVVAELFQKYFG